MEPKPCYNCNILHRVTLLLLFLGGFSTILAQKNLAVRMKVADEFSGDTIGGLKCDILNAADSAVLKSARVLKWNTATKDVTVVYAEFELKDSVAQHSWIFRFQAPGYRPVYYNWQLAKNERKVSGTIQIRNQINMRRLPRERKLGEVTVKATKVKFYYKGDTLVYDADAFEMAEGSMLEDLIRQLPGAELKEGGEILVNGRKVDELRLNGKNFFNSDRHIILENLPYYMVKNIKVFEDSDRIARLKGDDKAKLLAMDVRLKRQYSTTTISNAEGGIGTDNRYLGRLFLLRITKNTSFTAWGNINNLSDSREPGRNGGWSPLMQAVGVTRTINGGMSHRYQVNQVVVDNKLEASHNRTTQNTYTNQENFLQSGNTYARNFNRSLNHRSTIKYGGLISLSEIKN